MPTRISKERFDEFTFGLRCSENQEGWTVVACWSTDDEKVIAGLFYTGKVDAFMGLMLARDEQMRFRPFGQMVPFRTKKAGENAIQLRLRELESEETPLPPPDENLGTGVDLFSVTHDGELSPVFLNIRDAIHSQAARNVLSEIGRWFEDHDGNFVRDFQTAGTDARIWELYLYRVFRSLDFDIDQSIAVPDFSLKRDNLELYVEATTANSANKEPVDLTKGPGPVPDDYWKFIENEMPIIFGSPLFTKLKKAYWEKSPVKGKPFALAIADFHSPGSMTWTHTALPIYLYGVGVEKISGPEGHDIAVPKPLKHHKKGDKIIPANFFNQPNTEHISAVIFSNAGTKSKFTRMGTLAGFGSPEVAIRRVGIISNPEPGALDGIHFDVNIENGEYEENWADELEIYHNPNAAIPWPDETIIPEVAHFKEEDGELVWRGPPFRVLSSSTPTIHRPPYSEVDGKQSEEKQADK